MEIKCIQFGGWSDLVKDLRKVAHLHLNDPKHRDQTIGLVALLDLYGPTFYPDDCKTPSQRVSWAKSHFENQVSHPRFRMFFAVHEVEAWFLSNPALFPDKVGRAIRSKARNPEEVNFDLPPKALLKKLYREKLKQTYKEVTLGSEFFSRLDPVAAAAVCPNLKAMLDEMIALAKDAGL